jgi:hypothetical protein
MANIVEEPTVTNRSTNFRDYTPSESRRTSVDKTTTLGEELGPTLTQEKQTERPVLRNTAATQAPVNLVDGLTANELAAGIVEGTENIIQEDQVLANNLPTISQLDTEAALLDPTDPRYSLNPTDMEVQAQLPEQAETVTMQDSRTGEEGSYEVATAEDKIEDVTMTGVRGELSDDTIISDAAQLDLDAIAKGETELGSALKDAITIDIANVIDTSTVAGKLLADELGEGNYVDSKATVKGQLDILAKDFTDVNGNAVIPTWAASTYRDIQRTVGFAGLTGSASMAAVSGAIMESALDIAKLDSKFFETLTIKNLDNRQETAINRANVLSKLEIENLDNRQEALVQNAKSFLALDLKNLDNEQQAELVNTEMRSQAIFDATNAENIQRKFEAQTEAELMKVYDTLALETEKFNALQLTAHEEFKTESLLAADKFNADLANNREQFQIKNQLLIDETNAKWRQDVTLTNTEMAFTAAATDIKNSLAISAESLNRLWDQADQILDYLWKSTENELDRASSLSQTIISGEFEERASIREARAARSAGRSKMLGQIAGALIGGLF